MGRRKAGILVGGSGLPGRAVISGSPGFLSFAKGFAKSSRRCEAARCPVMAPGPPARWRPFRAGLTRASQPSNALNRQSILGTVPCAARTRGEGGCPVLARKLTVTGAVLVAAMAMPLAGLGTGAPAALASATPVAPGAARPAVPPGAPLFATAGDLDAVSASSARNAWAVGYAGADPAVASRTLAVHWNGKTWTRAPSPSPGRQDQLLSVAVLSPHLAWAVGAYETRTGEKTLILRWNGRTWKQVSSPSPGVLNSLTAVAVLSARDAWAAGTGENDNGDVIAAPRPARRAGSPPPAIDLVLHWNGTRWQRVPCCKPPPSGAR